MNDAEGRIEYRRWIQKELEKTEREVAANKKTRKPALPLPLKKALFDDLAVHAGMKPSKRDKEFLKDVGVEF